MWNQITHWIRWCLSDRCDGCMAGWTERDLTSTWLSLLKPSLRDLGEAPPVWRHSSVQFLLQLITELSTSLLGLDAMCSQGFLRWLLDLWRHFSSVGIMLLWFPSEQLILLPFLHSLPLSVCFLPRHSLSLAFTETIHHPAKGFFQSKKTSERGEEFSQLEQLPTLLFPVLPFLTF